MCADCWLQTQLAVDRVDTCCCFIVCTDWLMSFGDWWTTPNTWQIGGLVIATCDDWRLMLTIVVLNKVWGDAQNVLCDMFAVDWQLRCDGQLWVIVSWLAADCVRLLSSVECGVLLDDWLLWICGWHLMLDDVWLVTELLIDQHSIGGCWLLWMMTSIVSV